MFNSSPRPNGGPFWPMQSPFAAPQPANFQPTFVGQLAGHPVGFHQPAFNGGQFGGLAQVFSPMPLPQANFQPQPERMMMSNGLIGTRIGTRIFPQGAPQVQADLGYQQPTGAIPAVPVFSPAQQLNYLPQPIVQQGVGFSPPPAFQSPVGSPNSGVQARGAPQQSPSYLLSSMHDAHSSFYGSNTPSSLVSDETQRKNLYSISYFSSSDSLAQNASPQIPNKSSNTSIIFHEYRSASPGGGVSPADFIANYYGNGNSNSDVSPLVKICKMELATPITIGNCVINGERNYIDINEGGNKTRIHIDNEGARDLEKYRILVREELEKLRNNIDFNLLSQDEFKNLKSVNEFNDFFTQQPTGVQVTNDDRTLDAFADTFISNNLKAGRFKTEIVPAGGGLQDKPFAYVKIERPKGDEKKINVTVSDKYSAELNSININAGKNSNNEEVFFQLSVKQQDDKQVIAQDSLKYFTKNGNGEFKLEKDVKKGRGWGLKSIGKLGDAKDKTINIYTHKENEGYETLKYKIKGGKFVNGYMGYTYDSTVPDVHKKQKVKCGELNNFTDHEFMNVQSRSVSPQAGARGGPQSPDQVASGGMAVGQSVVSSPMTMMGVPMSPQPAMVAPMSPQPAMGAHTIVAQPPILQQPAQFPGGPPPAPMLMGGGMPIGAPAPMPMMGQMPIMAAPGPMMMGGGQFPVVQQVPMMGGGMPVHARAVPPMVMMPAPQTHFQPLMGGQPLQQINAGQVLHRGSV